MGFKVNNDLEFNKNYKIKLSTISINGHENMVEYPIIKSQTMVPILNTEVITSQGIEAKDNGYI
jgi:hypothetical protein